MFESLQRLWHFWLPKPMQDFHHQFKVCFRPQIGHEPVECHHKIPFNRSGDQDGLREAWLQQFPLRCRRLHWALAWFRGSPGEGGVISDSIKAYSIWLICTNNLGLPAADELCQSYLEFQKWKISPCQLIQKRSISAGLDPKSNAHIVHPSDGFWMLITHEMKSVLLEYNIAPPLLLRHKIIQQHTVHRRSTE